MSILSISRKNQYKAIDKLATIAVAVGTHTLFQKGWKTFTKHDPPENPSDPGVQWKDAFMWGAATGLGIGMSKVLMQILVDASWEKYKGPRPSGV